jgi:hypothetical protein
VLAIFAGLHLDPVLQMFTWISQVGVLGVLGMMAITSLAVVRFFARQGGGSTMTTMVLPVVSGLVMAALFVYIFVNFGDLTGTKGGALGLLLPSMIPAAGVVGWLLAGRLKSSNPTAFAGMGASRA